MKKTVYIIMLLLVSVCLSGQEITSELKNPVLSRTDIIYNTYRLASAAISRDNGQQLKQILESARGMIYNEPLIYRLLDTYADVLLLDEQALKNADYGLEVLSQSLWEILKNTGAEGISDDESPGYIRKLYDSIINMSEGLLLQYPEDSLAGLWLLYFAGREKDFFKKIWADGPEKSLLHQNLWKTRISKNTEKYRSYEIISGLDFSYYIPLGNQVIPDNRFAAAYCCGFSDSLLYAKVKLGIILDDRINPATFNIKGTDMETDRLYTITYSSEGFMSFIEDPAYPFQAGILTDIRLNTAVFPDWENSVWSLGFGAGLCARFYFGKLQSVFLDIKAEYLYDFYRDWEAPGLAGSGQICISISGGFASGLLEWDWEREEFNRRYFISEEEDPEKTKTADAVFY